jgi:hypothetical protein
MGDNCIDSKPIGPDLKAYKHQFPETHLTVLKHFFVSGLGTQFSEYKS